MKVSLFLVRPCLTKVRVKPFIQELYQKRIPEKFLNHISDKTDGEKHKIKSVSELNKILEDLKKKK